VNLRVLAAAAVLSAFATGVAQSADQSPAPPSCPNASHYTDFGTRCTQATRDGDVDAQVKDCQTASLEAGECAARETGLAALFEIGNEASFARTAGLAIHAQSGQNDDTALGWLRLAMALYHRLANDPTSPADVRAAASKYAAGIAGLPWYVDGPPPSRPPGPPPPPPRG